MFDFNLALREIYLPMESYFTAVFGKFYVLIQSKLWTL